MSQAEDIVPIGLDTGFSDPLDLWGMSDYNAVHQGNELIIDLPGVGGGFEHDDVGREQVGLSSGWPFWKGYLAWM